MNAEVKAIRAEIERMLAFDGSVSTSYYIGKRDAERELKAFIDSLPDEPAKRGQYASCIICTNDKGCVTCVNGSMWEHNLTKLSGHADPPGEKGVNADDIPEIWDMKEVNLEKEIRNYIPRDQCPVPDFMEAVARHFYELGKQAKKEGKEEKEGRDGNS